MGLQGADQLKEGLQVEPEGQTGVGRQHAGRQGVRQLDGLCHIARHHIIRDSLPQFDLQDHRWYHTCSKDSNLLQTQKM